MNRGISNIQFRSWMFDIHYCSVSLQMSLVHTLKYLFPVFTDRLLFRWQQLRYFSRNRRYRREHPTTAFPAAYTLYESYQLNYRKYIEDGALTAQEIIDSIKAYIPPTPQILDWGCGPARITRHLKTFCKDAFLTGCDTNTKTIQWNQDHIHTADFIVQPQQPPLPFPDQQFDLIICFSVFTHIPAATQEIWLSELYRILKPGGILWITTHGNYFIQQLSGTEKKEISNQGIYNTPYPITGHRMMTTYHHPEKFAALLKTRFQLIAHYDGSMFPEKAGRQDLWVVRKSLNF
ncbi:MAG: methyltransferase domain-containing protein [Sediminibacterium sp.]